MKRNLLVIGMFVFISIRMHSQTPLPNADYTKDKTLHVIGTAHFDTQWEWTIQTSINEYVKKTMVDNFKLFEKYPDYNFSFEGSIKYMFMKEYYPEDYAKVKDYIEKGRWHICGSSVDATDVNIPSPESVIRTVLLGQNFYKREFNKRSYDIFLPDCFGFGYALPTIMNHCGLKGFSTQKLTWGAPYGVPFDIGAWEGVDGSKVFAALNAGDYTAKLRGDLSYDKKWIDVVDKTGEKSGLFVGYRYFGVGDRGGAPEDSSVFYLEKAIHSDGPLKVINPAADLLCQQLTPLQLEKLPQFNGELLTSPHGTGCYTSQTAMKRWNRKNELLADAAERASVIADWLGATKYPKHTFEEAWVRFLFHQFHDDLTGTSIPEVYEFSWNDELISMKQFASIIENATGGITEGLNTTSKGASLVVYNPLSIDREDIVEATITLKTPTKFVKVFNKEGKEIPSQIVETNGSTVKILVLAKVPSVGFEVFDVQPSDKPCELKTGLSIKSNILENSRYKVTIDVNGDVSSILDKLANKELLAAPSRLQMLNDKSVTWPGWEIMYNDVMSTPRAFVDGGTIKLLESGPVRVAFEIIRFRDGSVFNQTVSLSAGNAGEKVDFTNEVNWTTKGTLLKAAFPLSVSNPLATYDLGMGTISRGNNKEKLYEVPAQQWADITNTDGSYGVSIMSDCKIGWDKPTDNILRLSLIHTPLTGGYHLDHSTNDIGLNLFSYSIAGHKGDWKNGNSPWLAARLNQPLIAFQSDTHNGKLGKSFSMLKVNSDQVMIKSCKVAENNDEVVVRVQELNGADANNITLTAASRIVSAKEVNGMEEVISDYKVTDGKLIFNLKKYQPRAFAIKFEKALIAITAKTNETIPLNFDIDGISSDNNRADGDFNGKGISYPAELLPSEIVCDDVQFRLGSSTDGQKNFLSCKGNTIALPSGDYNTIYILASALSDTKAVFKIDNIPVDVEIPSFTGKIGQWDTRRNLTDLANVSMINGHEFSGNVTLEPAYVKKTPLAWVGSHTHNGKNNSNEAYVFCYLFKIALDLPKGTKTLTLPNDGNIRIAGITISNDQTRKSKPAQKLYDQLNRIPTISIKAENNSSMFLENSVISINSGNLKGPIYYTVDGTLPNEKSMKYDKPFTINSTALVNALVMDGRKPLSSLASAQYYKIELLPAFEVKGLINGLNYAYFEDNNKEGEHWRNLPDFSKLPIVKQGEIKSIELPDCKREDFFGVDYNGFINITKDGVYTFYLNSDDGSKLFIDGILITSNDGNHGISEMSGSAGLKAGFHKINIQYFDGSQSNVLEVLISSEELKKQLIPAEMLYK